MPALTRQEHVHTLAPFMAAVSRAIDPSTPSPEKRKEAAAASMSGECVQCHIHVSGEELLALPKLTPADATKDRIARLLQGHCVRNGCDSRYYLLTFAEHPDLDWPKLLSQTESAAQQGPAEDATGERPSREVDRSFRRRRLAIRLGIGVAVLTLLLLIRQWYLGGRIPLIREPENFQVDHVPTHQPTP